jgi:hypothetical protein
LRARLALLARAVVVRTREHVAQEAVERRLAKLAAQLVQRLAHLFLVQRDDHDLARPQLARHVPRDLPTSLAPPGSENVRHWSSKPRPKGMWCFQAAAACAANQSAGVTAPAR